MLPRGLLVLALLAALCGCASGGGSNPNLLAPKLVVQPRPDGNVTLFVHGAFREQSYDWIAVHVDNATLDNRTDVFSLEDNVRTPGFFLDVLAQSGQQLFETRARFDVDVPAQRAHVALQGADGGWSDPRAYGFPYERILDHVKVSS